MFKDKAIIIGVLVTTVLIIGGVFFFSKGASTPSSSTNPISRDILVPQGKYQSGGIVNGTYLPASESAKLTLVEFGDYECPACVVYHPFIKNILTDYSGKVNFVFRNYPLSQHKNAQIASQAVEAAGLQGKYWQMHDKIFESTSEWAQSADPKSLFIGYAKSLELDTNKYTVDIDSSVIKDTIKADMNDGNLVKLNATPTYYLNGVKLDPLPSTYDNLKALIERELAK